MNYYKDGVLKDYYEILEVHRMASDEIVNRAFKVLAKKYHPDLNSNTIAYANFKMAEINEAYEVLNDEYLRAHYNSLYDSIILNKTNGQESDTTINKDNEKQYYEPYHNKATQSKNNKMFKYFIAIAVIFVIYQIIKTSVVPIDSQLTSNDDTVYDNVAKNTETDDNLFLYLKSQNETISLEGYVDFTENFTSEIALIGIAIMDNIEVRNGPTNDYDVVYSFNEEDIIIVVGKMNNWYDIYVVNDNNSLYGWVPNDVIDTYWYNTINQQFAKHIINKSLDSNYVYNTEETVKIINSSPLNNIDNDKEVTIKPTVETFITLGSNQDEVINVMGTPDAINDYYSFVEWSYELSSIKFDNNGKVIGWYDLSNNLKVNLGEKDLNSPFITLGSTKQDVINAMGTPDSINDYYSFIEWGYELSSIKFDNNGKVIGWNDLSKNLKVSLGEKDLNSPSITLGSTEQDVINAMGTPDSINDYYSFTEWGYELSSIQFDNSGRVIKWNNLSNNLRTQ